MVAESAATISAVMVAVDGSRHSEAALPVAAALARGLPGGLTVVKVAETDEESDRAYVDGVAARLGAEALIITGDAEASDLLIRDLAGKPETLLVMATHGHGGILESVVGSFASRIVRALPRPVMLVRPPGSPVEELTFEVVVVPLDGSDFSASVLPHAVALTRALKAPLELVNVLEPEAAQIAGETRGDVMESSYIRSVATRLSGEGVNVGNWDVLHGDPAGAIGDYVRGRKGAILAMATHGRSGLLRTIFGSVAGACILKSGVPVLVYRPQP